MFLQLSRQFTLLVLLCLQIILVSAQDNQDIIDACTGVKKSVYDKTDGFSFLLLNEPITTKKVDTCESYTPLIIGGSPADPKEFPPMALLGHRNSDNATNWFCGGTLISSNSVLTAAHCLYSTNGDVNVVRLGELDLDSEKDDAQPEDFGVRNTTEHPEFKYPDMYNDIAIIRLDRPVRFNVYKHPVCLPFSDGSRYEHFIAAGWGYTTVAGNNSSILRKVKLDAFGDRCVSVAGDIVELPGGFNATTQICIGSTQARDTCSGDSGGPVLVYHNDFPCMYHVIGITSIGIGCGVPNIPGIYTRVHFYLDWIRQQMARRDGD